MRSLCLRPIIELIGTGKALGPQMRYSGRRPIMEDDGRLKPQAASQRIRKHDPRISEMSAMRKLHADGTIGSAHIQGVDCPCVKRRLKESEHLS